MTGVEDSAWWIGGFVVVVLLCVAAMLWRNSAAKTDDVNHSKMDEVDSSVSVRPKQHTDKQRVE